MANRWRRAFLLALVVAGVSLALPLGAVAVVVRTKENGFLSYQPLPARPPLLPFDQALSNVEYNGGPVLERAVLYALYWQPSTSNPYPPGYQEGVDRFLEDLTASGGVANMLSVAQQYDDHEGGRAGIAITFGGPLTDNHPYPQNGCRAAPLCLTARQLGEEIGRYVEANHLPTGTNALYLLLTPPGVEGCLTLEMGEGCSAGSSNPYFCAYHLASSLKAGGEVVWAFNPYLYKLGCSPEADPSGEPVVESEIEGGLVHELLESLTDPLPPFGWSEQFGPEAGLEIGDKCNTGTSIEYGIPLGEANGAPYNQEIDGRKTYVQQFWSDFETACKARLEPLPLSFANITQRGSGSEEETFTLSGSTAVLPGAVKEYDWETYSLSQSTLVEHEGSSPELAQRAPAGLLEVMLTVFGEKGEAAGTAAVVAVGKKPLAPTLKAPAKPTPQSPATYSGEVEPLSQGDLVTAWKWNFGDRTAPAAGSALRNATHTYQAPGTYPVTLTVEDSFGQRESYTAPVVVKRAQTVTFTPALPTQATAGQSPLTVQATSSAGLPLTVSVAPHSAACSLSGATLTFLGPGSCTVRASQAGNNLYWEASAEATITVVSPARSTTTTTAATTTTSSTTTTETVLLLPPAAKRKRPLGGGRDLAFRGARLLAKGRRLLLRFRAQRAGTLALTLTLENHPRCAPLCPAIHIFRIRIVRRVGRGRVQLVVALRRRAARLIGEQGGLLRGSARLAGGRPVGLHAAFAPRHR